MFSTIECELSTNICTYVNYILLFTTGMFAFDCFNICAENGAQYPKYYFRDFLSFCVSAHSIYLFRKKRSKCELPLKNVKWGERE